MNLLPDPRWGLVYYSWAICGAALLALLLLRIRIGHKRKSFYDPEAYAEEMELARMDVVAKKEEPSGILRRFGHDRSAVNRARDLSVALAFFLVTLGSFVYGTVAYLAITGYEEGNRLAAAHDFEEAKRDYYRTLRYCPNSTSVHYALARVLLAQGRSEEAITEFHKVMGGDQNNVGAHTTLGNLLFRKGRLSEAIAEYRASLQLDPADAAAHVDLGNALYSSNQVAEAIGEYRNALRILPSLAVAHLNLSSALLKRGSLDEAAAEARQAANLAPDSVVVHSNLGNIFLEQGKKSDAIEEYRRATEIKPNFAYGYYNLGQALLADKKKDEAILAFESYLRIAKDQSEYGEAMERVLQLLADLKSPAVQHKP